MAKQISNEPRVLKAKEKLDEIWERYRWDDRPNKAVPHELTPHEMMHTIVDFTGYKRVPDDILIKMADLAEALDEWLCEEDADEA